MDQNVAFNLSGRHIAVVGGSGLIGHAIVEAATLCGARVTILDQSPPSARPKDATFKEFDITNFDSPNERIASLEKETGDLDGWVNCAYPRTPDWSAPESELASATESWRKNIDLQLNTACIWATAIAERMAQRGNGAIVQVASVYGVVAPDPHLYEGLSMGTPAAYTAIKGGTIAHTRNLSAQFAPKVRVNVVCPGGVHRDQQEEFLKRYSARTCIGRLAEPSEIAWPIVFLLSDAANYMTGTTLMVDGGLTAI